MAGQRALDLVVARCLAHIEVALRNIEASAVEANVDDHHGILSLGHDLLPYRRHGFLDRFAQISGPHKFQERFSLAHRSQKGASVGFEPTSRRTRRFEPFVSSCGWARARFSL